jgi:hypothetical protein
MATKIVVKGIQVDPGVLWVLAGTLSGANTPAKGATYRVAHIHFRLTVAPSNAFVSFASIDDQKYTRA